MRINNPQNVESEDIDYIEGLMERIGDTGLPLDSVTFWTLSDDLIGTSFCYKERHDLRPIAKVRLFYADSEDTLTECLDTIHLHQLIDYEYGRYTSLVRMGNDWMEIAGLFDHSYLTQYNITRVRIERGLRKKRHQHGNVLPNHASRDGGAADTEGVQALGPGVEGDGDGAGAPDGGDC